MSVDLCAAQVARSDPERFATAMTAPLPGRGDLMVLYAFNLEVARAPWVTSEPMLAEMRLQWWRDAVAEIFEDRTPRRHEVVTPLAEAVRRLQLPRGPFDAMIDARRFEIYAEAPPDPDRTRRFVAESAGMLMELAARALGASEAEAGLAARAGLGQGAAALLLAREALAAAGRPPLPDDREAVRGFARAALGDLEAARRGAVSRRIAPALRPALGAAAVLRQAVRRPDAPPVPASEGRRRLRLAFAAITGGW